MQSQPFLDIAEPDARGRRAGAARPRVRTGLREEPPLRRRLHRHERQHARRALPLERLRGAARQRAAAALRRAAVPEPQRRQVAYGPDGLLYVGMGDGGSGGDPGNRAQSIGVAARQDPAPRPGPAAVKPVVAVARRPQPVAVLVRPRQRRPLDRRCRPGHDRGGRPRRMAVAGPAQLRLERLRGPLAVQGRAARPGRLVAPVAQYSHARRLLDHRRLRLPRLGGALVRRPLLLRRLLLRRRSGRCGS